MMVSQGFTYMNFVVQPTFSQEKLLTRGEENVQFAKKLSGQHIVKFVSLKKRKRLYRQGEHFWKETYPC